MHSYIYSYSICKTILIETIVISANFTQKKFLTISECFFLNNFFVYDGILYNEALLPSLV